MSFLGGGSPVTGPRSIHGVPPARDGVPPQSGIGYISQPGMGYIPQARDGVPPVRNGVYPPARDEVPPSQPDLGYPPRIGQQMEYLIRGRRYASCVHGGGLSCLEKSDSMVPKTGEM